MGHNVRKRAVILIPIAIALALFFIYRVGHWQFIRGDQLRTEAAQQQTRDRLVQSPRGSILDRNGKELAVSATVETVSVTPKTIRDNNKNIDIIAARLAGILEMDPKDVLDIFNRQTSYEIVKRRVDKDTAKAVRAYVAEADVKGISLDEDTKRMYPLGSFAAHVIGFTGTDNVGLSGIEMVLNSRLVGEPGRVVSAKNAAGDEMPFHYERRIDPKEGEDVVLTLDEVIQLFAEKHLNQAFTECEAAEGASCIVMDPKTGEILAMAVEGTFDLNDPFYLTDEEKEVLKPLEGVAYNEAWNDIMQPKWRNKAVQDSYEPGSTFKIITASAALEEGLVSENDHFYCGGVKRVGTWDIHCHNRAGHGMQTFREGIQNSCNIVVMELAERLGSDLFKKYIKSFGFFETTGIELNGEQSGIFYENFGEVDMATSSFGQGFQVTPLQMMRAVSAVANGGNLVRPHLVKEYRDRDGNVTEKVEPVILRQVISKQTSQTMSSILESVVSEGTGKNAFVKGYHVAGKTGTSEKNPRGTEKRIASFIGFAPADDPKLCCLVMLDEPQTEVKSGGYLAAPVVARILDDSLNYLGIEPDYNETTEVQEFSVPDVKGLTLDAARTALNESGFSYTIHGEGETVVAQNPPPMALIRQGGTVHLYTEAQDAEMTVVPDLSKKSAVDCNVLLTGARLNMRMAGNTGEGAYYAMSQSPEAGTEVPVGSIVTVEFRSLEQE